ncbi:MAG: LysR family transcriptional regulator [Propionibacteriaceae bacterium]|jgi:molybdate transport repressor ModE-like protein|nr:LysR family transcriptional regulator [Propionibacteriaceae bacterium]
MTGLPLLDPKRVLIFRLVAEEGSMSAAARTLGWTPPAISQHLAALEKVVGASLIHRHHGGVQVTPAGAILARHADTMAAALEAAQEELSALTRQGRGVVRLAAFPSALPNLVPAVLAALRPSEKNGRGIADVQLTEADSAKGLEMLRQGGVDIALTFDYVEPGGVTASHIGLPYPTPTDLAGVDLGGDEVVVVMSTRHPLAATPKISLRDFADFTWIIAGDLCRDYLERSAGKADFRPRIFHLTHDEHLVKTLVTHDPDALTVATVPKSVAARYGGKGLTTRALPEFMARRFAALYKPGTEELAPIRRCLECLVDVARSEALRTGLA